jgi:spermidine synthase
VARRTGWLSSGGQGFRGEGALAPSRERPCYAAGLNPWIVIERAHTPDGTPLELLRRGGDFVIRAAGQELMSSRLHGSEVRLAELGVAALAKQLAPRVLVGGLGCGYTLAAALDQLSAAAEVVVAELSPAVVAWNRGVLGALARHPLDDPRVHVREADVVDELAQALPFDLILLDVDNGPAALTQAHNARLYDQKGVASLWAALRPRGVLGVWSAGPDADFAQRLRAQRFGVTEHAVRAHTARSGKRHTIWIAVKA